MKRLRVKRASWLQNLSEVRDDLVGEPVDFGLDRLELQHEQLDSGVVVRLDSLDHLLVAADQPR